MNQARKMRVIKPMMYRLTEVNIKDDGNIKDPEKKEDVSKELNKDQN